MTNTQVDGTNLVVVDGSNIATEGRSIPSLAQLNEAVISLTQEFPDITVTVVVDATFGHRIQKSEVAEFDEAVAHNELVTPPAGAIGRGDAFVLSIANKVGARIFSNDSFQEFHGVYPWLFDEGRLIGGKPVPHVGWVFVNRVPVKGPLSRKARNAGRDSGRESGTSRRPSSPLASLPMPIPTSPPPRGAKAVDAATAGIEQQQPARGRRRKSAAAPADALPEAVPATGRDSTPPPATPAPVPTGGPVNDLLPFLDFIQQHPVGSGVTGQVESYSSHGAYVAIGDLRGYVPLRMMGNPPPRSAREVMRAGEPVALVVASIAPARRSVDLAVPGVVDIAAPEPPAADVKPARKRGTKKAAALADAATAAVGAAGAAEPTAAAALAGDAAAEAPATSQQRGRRKKAAASPTAEPAPVKKSATKRASASKAVARKVEPAPLPPPVAPEDEAAPAKRSRAKKAASPVRGAPEPSVQPAKPRKAAAKKVPASTVPVERAEPTPSNRRASPRRRAQRAS